VPCNSELLPRCVVARGPSRVDRDARRSGSAVSTATVVERSVDAALGPCSAERPSAPCQGYCALPLEASTRPAEGSLRAGLVEPSSPVRLLAPGAPEDRRACGRHGRPFRLGLPGSHARNPQGATLARAFPGKTSVVFECEKYYYKPTWLRIVS